VSLEEKILDVRAKLVLIREKLAEAATDERMFASLDDAAAQQDALAQWDSLSTIEDRLQGRLVKLTDEARLKLFQVRMQPQGEA